MPEIADIRRLKTWRVRGRTWLSGKGEGTERELLVLTQPGARAEEAIRLGHAALAAQEPVSPAKVEVDGVDAGEPIHAWGSDRF